MAKSRAKRAVRQTTAKVRPARATGATKPRAKAMARQPSRARGRDTGPRMPSYDELPVRAGAPAGAAWGVFGADDEVGTINLLTAARVREAARLVRNGTVFALNL